MWEPVSRRDVQDFLARAPEHERNALLAALDSKTTPQVSYELKGGTLPLSTRLFGF